MGGAIPAHCEMKRGRINRADHDQTNWIEEPGTRRKSQVGDSRLEGLDEGLAPVEHQQDE